MRTPKINSIVSFDGRTGVVVGHMPAGMVDIRFHDSPNRIERRAADRLVPAVRRNPSDDSDEELKATQEFIDLQKRRGLSRSFLRVAPAHVYEEKRAKEEEDAVSGKKDRKGSAKELKQHKTPKIVNTPVKTGVGGGRGDTQARVENSLSARGATVFTQEDPPKFSKDGSAFCGNPIDGVAYYLTVAENPRQVGTWLKIADVKTAAGDRLLTDDQIRAELFPELEKTFKVRFIPVTHSGGSVWGLRDKKRSVSYRTSGASVRVKQGGGLREDMLPGGLKPKKASFMSADPQVDFSVPAPGGNRTFFKIIKQRSLGAANLARFNAFNRRRYESPSAATLERYADKAREFGTLPVAISVASEGEISIKTALLLIASCAVQVGDPTDSRSSWGRQPVRLVTDPEFIPAPGAVLEIGLAAKAADPMFSWVPAIAPIRPAGSEPVCLSGTDLEERAELQAVASTLKAFDRSVEDVRLLFLKAAQNPSQVSVYDAPRCVKSLSFSFAKAVRLLMDLNEKRFRGDEAALRVIDFLDKTALRPSEEDGAFNKALAQLSSTSDVLGLVTDTGQYIKTMKGPKGLAKSNAARQVKILKAKGYEAGVLDDEITVVWQAPAKAAVASKEDYSTFMNSVSKALLEAGSMLVPRELLSGPAEAMTSGSVSAVYGIPARSAIGWLGGAKTHPMDDIYTLVLPGIPAKSNEVLQELRRVSDPQDMLEMRNSDGGNAAIQFSQLVGQYGVGGHLHYGERIDPVAFRFEADPNKRISQHVQRSSIPFLEEHHEMCWVVDLVVNAVFPAARVRYSPEVARVMCRDLIVLGYLYLTMQGLQFSGSLDPAGYRAPHLIASVLAAIAKRSSEISGGSSLEEPGQYKTFVTYNPVLFEITRLFWPDAREKSPGFGSLLAHADDLLRIDAVGRYGAAYRLISRVKLGAENMDTVKDRIQLAVWPGVAETEKMLVIRNLMTGPNGVPVQVPPAAYEAYLTLWPVGVESSDLPGFFTQLIQKPLNTVANLKRSAEQAFGHVLSVRPTRKGDLPFYQSPSFSANHVPIHPASAVAPQMSVGADKRPYPTRDPILTALDSLLRSAE